MTAQPTRLGPVNCDGTTQCRQTGSVTEVGASVKRPRQRDGAKVHGSPPNCLVWPVDCDGINAVGLGLVPALRRPQYSQILVQVMAVSYGTCVAFLKIILDFWAKMCYNTLVKSNSVCGMPGIYQKRSCEYCGQVYRPRVEDQRWCRRWCRKQAMALAGRAARRAWIEAGRPVQAEVREAFDRDHRAIDVAAIRRR